MEDIVAQFPDLKESVHDDLSDILSGRVVGSTICHIWNEDDGFVLYTGKIDKLKKRVKKYVVAYWAKDDTYDAIDYDMSMYDY